MQVISFMIIQRQCLQLVRVCLPLVGWQREIVFRATQNPAKAGGARADIYYYAPSGKKLRSRVEIEDYREYQLSALIALFFK